MNELIERFLQYVYLSIRNQIKQSRPIEEISINL